MSGYAALRDILSGVITRYRSRVEIEAIENALLADGAIASRKQLTNDHIAFRTLGAPHLGIASLEPLFEHYGYTRRDAFTFAQKHLRAYWYAPPSDDLPRLFISELCIEELPAAVGRLLRSYTDCVVRGPFDGLPFDDAISVISAFESPVWPLPSVDDYRTLVAESEYAAWTIVNGYQLNHITLSVHELRADLQSVAALSRYLTEHGFALNDAGGTVKVSPDGLLVQSSTAAQATEMTFRDNRTALVAGPYIEFAERRVLPEFKHLPRAALRREHRRDGFETANADRIFESTDLSRRT